MKRNRSILVLGVFPGHCRVLRLLSARRGAGTRSAAQQDTGTGLAEKEFDLSDAELARITELHQAYRPHCVEMCRRIDAKNAELKELLARTSAMTPEVEQKLAEAAQLRLECQEAMPPAFHGRQPDHAPRTGKTLSGLGGGTNLFAGYGMEEK